MDVAERLEQLERSLHNPAERRDRAVLEDLIDPLFREIGASGRISDRDSIIAALISEPGAGIRAWGFETLSLHDGVYLLTYRTDDGSGGRCAVRSSIWRVAGDGSAAIVFHQGTLVAAGGEESPVPEEN